MKLVRNEGIKGKYAIINLQQIPEGSTITITGPDGEDYTNALNFGPKNTEHEFFVLMLKDRFVKTALDSYANSAELYDPEYAAYIRELALRAGPNSVFCKKPD